MRAFRVKKVVTEDGRLQLEALPFQAGEMVEIIVLALEPTQAETATPPHHTLKDSVIKYEAPTDPVALDGWDALK